MLICSQVLALGDEMYNAPTLPQDPAIFLHIPRPASRDSEGGSGTVSTASSTPQQTLLGPRGPDCLSPRRPIPSGDAGAGVGRSSYPGSYQSRPPLPLPRPPPPPPSSRELRPEEGQAYGQLAGVRLERSSGAGLHQLHPLLSTPTPPPPPPPPPIGELRPEENAAYGQLATTSFGFRPPQHVVITRQPAAPVDPLTHRQHEGTSPGWIGNVQDFRLGAWGALPQIPHNVPQADGRVGGGVAGAAGSRAVERTPPGRGLPITALGGRSAGGSNGEGSDAPPTPRDKPASRTSEGMDSVSKLTPESKFFGGEFNGTSRPIGGRIAAGASTSERRVTPIVQAAELTTNVPPGLEQVQLRRMPSVNDSTFINLADKTHDWPFGAIAELIHNSSDAEATEVRVSLEDLGPDKDTNFVVIDNGRGMTHPEMAQMFALGKDYGYGSNAPADERIGCNGFGFKQGVLRLGDTAVVISVRGKWGCARPATIEQPSAGVGYCSILQDFVCEFS